MTGGRASQRVSSGAAHGDARPPVALSTVHSIAFLLRNCPENKKSLALLLLKSPVKFIPNLTVIKSLPLKTYYNRYKDLTL